MSQHELLSIARRWAVLLILSPILAGLVGFAIVRQVPGVYEASTILQLVPAASDASGEDLGVIQQLVHTYTEVIQTPAILEQTAAELSLDISGADLRQRVHASQIRDTRLIRISAEDTDPRQAAQLANTVARVFLARTADMQAARFAAARDNLARLVETLRGPVDARRAQLEAVRAQPSDPNRDAELARLQGELSQLESGYNAALRSSEDLHIAEARGSNATVVLEQARPPEQPVRPSWRIVTGLAALAGLAVAVGLLMMVEYLDDVLRDDARVTRTTGLVTLGLIPRGASSEQVAGGGDRLAHESYRSIGHNLLVATANMNLHLLMVTGPGSGEGKSVAAANLALALAETGRRVVLVDADLHRPSQAQLYGVTNRRGLSTLLVNEQETAASVLQSTQMSNVQLLPAGPPVPDPSALLTRAQVSARLDELTGLCDMVVLDTPPVLAQPDAQLLTSLVDATVLVVDATRSRGRDTARTVDLLHRSGGVVVGVILNRVAPRRMGYGGRSVADQPTAQVSEGSP